MRGLAFFSLLALAGCGSAPPPDNNNHGYGYQYDQIGATGLRVRWDGAALPSLSDIESLYGETMACTGVRAPGPLVIFTHPVPPGDTETHGATFLDTGTVFISTLLEPRVRSSFWTYKHEFVHYLLSQSGFDAAANANHESPLFVDCLAPRLSWPSVSTP